MRAELLTGVTGKIVETREKSNMLVGVWVEFEGQEFANWLASTSLHKLRVLERSEMPAANRGKRVRRKRATMASSGFDVNGSPSMGKSLSATSS